MIDKGSNIVEQLRDKLNEFVTQNIISIKRHLLGAAYNGRLSIEHDFGSSVDNAVIDEIIQCLRDEGLIVEYVPTASSDSKLYRISWYQPGLT